MARLSNRLGDLLANTSLLDTLPVALVQGPPVYLNLDASVELAVDYIERAARSGAWLTAFPETWLPGYPVWLDYAPSAGLWDHPPAKALFAHMVRECPTVPGPQIDQLHQAASRAGTHVVIGIQERDGASLYNTIVYLNADGVTRQIHRKLVPTYTERLVWGQGDGSTLGVMATERINVGALVCWEHWMPLARQALHECGEQLHVAQWPT
ncbi:MAG: nitrilase-related carbon-nitrogen hydrolase, partial [Pseudomonadota bacterium]